eukprot:6491523-Amphidinium_carterae.1
MPRSQLDRKNPLRRYGSCRSNGMVTGGLEYRMMFPENQRYIIKEDADVWVEGVINQSNFHMSYRKPPIRMSSLPELGLPMSSWKPGKRYLSFPKKILMLWWTVAPAICFFH